MIDPNTANCHLTINAIKDEACALVEQGLVSRQQPIHTLCKYISEREWFNVERELELNEYLLRDCIGDLIGREIWTND